MFQSSVGGLPVLQFSSSAVLQLGTAKSRGDVHHILPFSHVFRIQIAINLGQVGCPPVFTDVAVGPRSILFEALGWVRSARTKGCRGGHNGHSGIILEVSFVVYSHIMYPNIHSYIILYYIILYCIILYYIIIYYIYIFTLCLMLVLV